MENIDIEKLKELEGAISLKKYNELTANTDKFTNKEINPILLGLYGEVGGIMAASKKYRREKEAYLGYRETVEEEFGDALWYFSALCRRLNIDIVSVFESATKKPHVMTISANDQEHAPISQIITMEQIDNLDAALIDLGYMAAQLLKTDKSSSSAYKDLIEFSYRYLQAIQLLGISFSKVIKRNLIKTYGRFSELNLSSLPDFDSSFPEEEQLPRKFEIYIVPRNDGRCYLRWNGVFIGSSLTDNIRDPDGYRFHDVFHFAHAAILHWSPTFRALIKQKRKSDPVFDETQDSGRAIVVEEGLTAWLYSYSKGLNYFEGHDSVSFDVLKIIQKFVNGYEVDKCPLKLWERAIIQGYSIFRMVKKNNGGIIVGDREKREINYRPIGETNER